MPAPLIDRTRKSPAGCASVAHRGLPPIGCATIIGAFLRQYPQVQLQLISTHTGRYQQPRRRPVHRLRDWRLAGDGGRRIVALRFFPVCSPRSDQRPERPEKPAGTEQLPAVAHDRLFGLARLADRRGGFGVNATSGILFSDAHCAQSACIAGQVSRSASNLISGDALSKGLLVRPFDITIDLHRGYYLAADPQKAERAVVQAFSNWVKTQLQSSHQTWQDTL